MESSIWCILPMGSSSHLTTDLLIDSEILGLMGMSQEFDLLFAKVEKTHHPERRERGSPRGSDSTRSEPAAGSP